MSEKYFDPCPPLLGGLDEAYLEALFERGGTETLEPGAEPIVEGTQQDRLYVLLKGRVIVSRGAGDQLTELAELRAGEIFGEMAVFDPAPAAGTVRASEKCEVWWITRDGLESFLDASPAAASRLLHAVVRVLVQRMRAVSANLPATGGRLMEGWW